MKEQGHAKRSLGFGAKLLIWLLILAINMGIFYCVHAFVEFDGSGDYDPLELAGCPGGRIVRTYDYFVYNDVPMVKGYVIESTDGNLNLLFVERFISYYYRFFPDPNRYRVVEYETETPVNGQEQIVLRSTGFFSKLKGYILRLSVTEHKALTAVTTIGSEPSFGARILSPYFSAGFVVTLAEGGIYILIRKIRKKATA